MFLIFFSTSYVTCKNSFHKLNFLSVAKVSKPSELINENDIIIWFAYGICNLMMLSKLGVEKRNSIKKYFSYI